MRRGGRRVSLLEPSIDGGLCRLQFIHVPVQRHYVHVLLLLGCHSALEALLPQAQRCAYIDLIWAHCNDMYGHMERRRQPASLPTRSIHTGLRNGLPLFDTPALRIYYLACHAHAQPRLGAEVAQHKKAEDRPAWPRKEILVSGVTGEVAGEIGVARWILSSIRGHMYVYSIRLAELRGVHA